MVLAACGEIGVSGREAELARQQGERGFAVVSSRPERVVFAARDRRVAVEPPKGYCLDANAVEVSRSSASALVADCLDDRRAALSGTDEKGEVLSIELPRSFPGILTVTVSGEPAIGPGGEGMDAFEALLGTEAGRLLLVRGKNGTPVAAITMRRSDGALYVLVEETAEQPGFLSPRYWRGFIEINQRLVLVTVSGFADRPIAEDGMLGFLAHQMGQLRRANGLEVPDEETEIARLMEAAFGAPGGEEIEVVRSDRQAVTEDGTAPKRAPTPTDRYVAAAAGKPAGGTARAPLPVPRGAVRPAKPADRALASAANLPAPAPRVSEPPAAGQSASPASASAPQDAPRPPKRPG